MHLISLIANKETFKSVYFNEVGVSLVVGKRKSQSSVDKVKSKKMTYNGVGKSLMVALIHFCLGSSNNQEFEKKIPGWEFCLKFRIKGKEYISKRNTSSQDECILNDKKYTKTELGNLLKKELFLFSEVVGLGFRSLLTRFIRPEKSAYVSFDSTDTREPAYDKLIRNAFLLGIDTNLIEKKRSLKKELDVAKRHATLLSESAKLKTSAKRSKNVAIELKDIDDKIKTLENDLKVFRIAENYTEIQEEVNSLKRFIQETENKKITRLNALRSIEVSLENNPDIPSEKLIQLYKEADILMPENVVRKLDEVVSFHKRFIESRVKRLSSEQSRLFNDVEEIDKRLEELQLDYNTKIKYLSTNKAYDEIVKLTTLLHDLKSRSAKLQEFQNEMDLYKSKKEKILIELHNQNIKSQEYIKTIGEVLDKNLNRFRLFSSRLYHDKPGGISLESNEGENKIRFNLNVTIKDDKSDGINEAKIFCYDLTVLTGKHNHNMCTIVHDSRLFSDIDPRQRSKILKIAHETTLEQNMQYIATVNEDQIESMREWLTPDEYTKLVTNNIVLELTDESEEEKLLGIQVDLDY
jgi:uncharacterized protein YydD (DUF2326 family)